MLEFLVLEKGRGIDKPFPLPKLGINAVALRFLSFLSANTIKVKVEDFYVTLPHPANFALHKLIIFQRRLRQDKAIKDRNIAIEILKSLIDKGESSVIKEVFDSIPQKWQGRVIRGLSKSEDKDILTVLEYYSPGELKTIDRLVEKEKKHDKVFNTGKKSYRYIKKIAK